MLRLTLRTLLAYLDDTLSPTEARDIGQQIGEDPSINALIGRIKNVVRKRRLLADSPDPDHADVDPNDAAEYLDSVLTASRVAEFERRILEHDMDLAEVASVHQILSLVLGKPADVSSSAKERAYRLVKSRSKTHVLLEPIGPRSGAAAASKSSDEIIPLGPTHQPASNRFGTAAIVAALLVMLVFAVYITVTSPGSEGTRQQLASSAPVDGNAKQATEPTKAPSGEAPAVAPATVPPSEPTPADAPKESTDNAAKPSPATESKPSEPSKGDNPALPMDELDAVPEIDSSPSSPNPELDTDVVEAPTTTEEMPAEKPQEEEEMIGEEILGTGSELAKLGNVTTPAEPPKRAATPDAIDVANFVPLATYVSPTGLLLRRSNQGWSRLQSQTQLFAGELVANPDPGRTKLELATGLLLEMVGQTKIELQFDPAFDLAFRFPQGKIILSAPEELSQVRILIGSSRCDVALTEKGTTVALQSTVVVPTSSDGSRPPVWQLSVFNESGGVEVSRDSRSQNVPAGEQLLLRSDESTLGLPMQADKPAWMMPPSDAALDRALSRFSDEVPLGNGPSTRFRELINDNNKDMRLMAVNALASMGEVEALASNLRHPKYGPVRESCFQSLRTFARQGGDPLKSVQSALIAVFRPEVAGFLNELIIGYPDPSQRTVATFRFLIDRLESEDLAVREAALANLVELTGKNFNYSAESPTAQRKVAVGKWNKWLESQTEKSLRDLVPTKT